MARKSSSSFVTLAILGIGGYLAYENWPAISSWLTSIAAGISSGVAPIATAAATGSATYPNSPVPLTQSTMQTFVDSSGNQWQYSTQSGQWVIAAAGPASAGTIVAASTAPPAPAQAPPAAAAVPASPGTVVPIAPSPGAKSTLGPVTGPFVLPSAIDEPMPGPPGTNYVIWGPRAEPTIMIRKVASVLTAAGRAK